MAAVIAPLLLIVLLLVAVVVVLLLLGTLPATSHICILVGIFDAVTGIDLVTKLGLRCCCANTEDAGDDDAALV